LLPQDKYNVVVIGGGSAGLVTAYIAAAVKAKVVLVERHKMGGDCLNTGCVPSKALIKTAKVVAQIRNHQKYGIKSASCEVDFAQVMARVHQVIKKIEPHDSIERYTELGVECITGEAEVLDKHTVRVNGRTLHAKTIVLALGGSPMVPPIKGIETVRFLTSENLWDLKTLPKRLVVLGGGPIGCEMTQAFQRLGSAVTQVEMGPRLLPREDDDVAELIRKRFAGEGVKVMTGAKATAVETTPNGERVLLCETAGGVERVPFDEILVAVGRKANTAQKWDWGKLGIALNPNGTLQVDSFLRANGDNIYACGDVIGPYQFTHVAAHQAWYCAVNAIFSPLKKFKVDYRVIPWVTFTDPEVAQVGHNEQSAKAAGIPYEVTRYEVDDLDRAIAESEDYGQVKVLTVPGKDQLLGVNIVGANAGEIIAEYVTCFKYGLGLNKILGTIHSYPTYAEANKYAAGNWKKAHAPQNVLKYLEKFHGFRR
jgi:pyruvate/2-oxoglutarate dehydrogenase complex dihydrolipoamide dehydrogenase (E3) component